MSSDAESYNNLLIVDDDNFILKLLTKMFKNHYNIKSANNALDALKILEQGFMPGVILSDQMMPNMKGSEFLAQSHKYSPLSTRILLTGHFDTKEIIMTINEAKAYYYLTKPFIELELLQAVKVGFDNHKNRLVREQSILNAEQKDKELKALKLQVAKLSSLNKNFFFDTMSAFGNFVAFTEKFYFTSHTSYVTEISSQLAYRLRLKQDQTVNLELAAKLHNSILLNMPLKFKLIGPFDITKDNEYAAFLNYFNASVDIFMNTNGLTEIGKIIAQLFEHADGTGFPKNISGSNFLIEAQVLSIANLYHNMTYRLLPEQVHAFLYEGEVIQSKDDTLRRHNRAIKYLQNKESFYDSRVFFEFFELIKTRTSKELIPINRSLVLNNEEFEFPI